MLAPPVLANEVLVGPPRVVDGDTLVVAGTRIRLFGVDAPESAQLCKNKVGADYECGKASASALTDKIHGRQVACEVKNKDMYGRSVAVCRIEGREEVNQWLVDNGLAVAYKEYSGGIYQPDEERARSQGKGVWQGDFQYPAQWRKDRKANSQSPPAINGLQAMAVSTSQGVAGAFGGTAASAQAQNAALPPVPGCSIKGNISSSKSKIYHKPGGRYYDSTSIDLSSGERWFCTEAEAEAAGWRASRD